uniref:HTH cro/C1-type domain-containing protein n=1 Tax=Mycobacterium riyadhense TaxID=486698 RepID=A0A653EWU2_9MYCO|nr:hypothetical protein BIN_B_04194 [Mycobacterium riyadhense]
MIESASLDNEARTCRKCQRPSRSRGLYPTLNEQERSRLTAYRRWQSHYVDAQPVREHINALRHDGVGNKQLAKLSGVSRTTIQKIVGGRTDTQTGPTSKALRCTADKIMAVSIPVIAHAVVADGRRVGAVGTTRRLRTGAA